MLDTAQNKTKLEPQINTKIDLAKRLDFAPLNHLSKHLVIGKPILLLLLLKELPIPLQKI